MHVAPSEGTPRDVAGPVVDMLFPPGAPVARADCRHHRHQRQDHHRRMLAHITKMAGFTPGLTTTDGVYIDGQRTVEGDMTGPVATQMVLSDPQIDIAVLEVARGGLIRAGMGVPFVNVGAVINVQADHLGLKGMDTLEQLAEIKRIVVEVARDCAVLNADDPNVIRMSAYTEAKTICYVTINPSHALVREHIRAGGRACALEAGINGQMITLYDKGAPHSADLDASDPRYAGRARHAQRAERDVCRCHSVCAGHQARCHPTGPAHLRHHLLPGAGAHELFNEHPFKVIFDYGHNAHAVAAMCRSGAAHGCDGEAHRGAVGTGRSAR